MKRIIFAFCCFLFSGYFYCQDTRISWGPDLFKPRKSDIIQIIGSDQNSFYCLRSLKLFFGTGTSLEKYSISKLKLEYIKEFKLPNINNSELNFEKIFFMKGVLLVFASAYDKARDQKVLYLEKIDAASGTVSTPFEEVDAIKAAKHRNESSFNFTPSCDSSKILISYTEFVEKAVNPKLHFKLLTGQGMVLWSSEVEFQNKEKFYSVLNCQLDEDGKVFLLASTVTRPSQPDKEKPENAHSLLIYNYPEKRFKELDISLNDQFISAIDLLVVAKKTLVVAGLYANKNQYKHAGTFFMSIDRRSGQIITRGQDNFPKEFLMGFTFDNDPEKENELYNYRITGMISKNDGGIYLLAEQYYVQTETTYHSRMAVSSLNHYYFNDIVVVNISPNSSIRWAKKIRKLQHTINEEVNYSSYSYFGSEEKLHFMYNDHPKNISSKTKRLRDGIGKNMTTVITSVDANGNSESYSIFKPTELKMHVRPKTTITLASNQFLFYSFRKKESKFGIIHY
ncbi:hypothetical protein CNR22_08060 [Sphingobacteriaceae bacterium]|nr:hypothetical protein CNR22_08060 [Sphingobacteriaceae bacterium]